jgi:predicted metal-dependent phosphoesterase TrpH
MVILITEINSKGRENSMGLADLHIHSIYSHDATGSIPAILKYVADHTPLTVIALTDHDTLRGNQEAVQLAPRYGLEVIPGCEISTSEGHLLGLFIDRSIPPGLTLVESALRIGEQGGLCIIPHPTARGTSSVSLETLRKALLDSRVVNIIHGLEVYNGGLVYTRSNRTIREIAATIPLAQVGNSDSHILSTLGQGSTEFPGSTALHLRSALETRKTVVHEGIGLTGVLALREWAPRFLLRKLGWVTWNSGPEAPFEMVRLSRAVN